MQAAIFEWARDLPPEQAGRWVASLVILPVLLLSIAKCALIMRRPTTSRLCVAALMLVLVSWSCIALSRALVLWFEPPSMLVSAVLRVSGALLMPVALALGIAGLVRFDRQRLTQGRAQAIWAVALSGLVVVAFAVGLVIGIINSALEAEPPALDRQVQGAIENAEYNFSLHPPARWRVLPNPKAMGEDICLALRLPGPEIYAMVIAERPGGDDDLRGYAELVKNNIASEMKVKDQTEEGAQAGGQAFVVLRTAGRPEKSLFDMRYEHWIAAQGGFVWQIMAWCREKDRHRLPD